MLYVLQGRRYDIGVWNFLTFLPVQEVIILKLDMRDGAQVLSTNLDVSGMLSSVSEEVRASVEQDSFLVFDLR